ncbi:hypothetical protein NL108_009823 [Boleophthalmus pectinirostris]|nr:hypothetical protein NL108_009823 [Boleophthalmus pectinirostris]
MWGRSGQCGAMKGRGLLVLWVLLLLGCGLGVEGYSHGQVTESCVSMEPQHGSIPQTSVSPFRVSTEKTNYTAGQDVTVSLTATSSDVFEGFLLQARETASGAAVGSFHSAPSGTHTLTCGGKASSALAHSSSSGKKSIQVKWRPVSDRAVKFYATFVKTKNTYWVAVASPQVQFSGSYSGSSTAQPTTTGLSLLLLLLYWAL